MSKGEIVYIHCLGGHGRTAILAIILLALYYNISEEQAIKTWQKLRATRDDMGKSGYLDSPQNKMQYFQIHRILSEQPTNNIYFYDEQGKWGEFSNFYPSPREYKGKIYPTVEHAFQAAKFTNNEYQEFIRVAKTPGISKYLDNKKQEVDINGVQI